MMNKKFNSLSKTRRGALSISVISVVLAYFVASYAIDSANLFAYFFTFVFIYIFVVHFHKLFKLNAKGKRK